MPNNGSVPHSNLPALAPREPWQTYLGRMLLSRQVGALAGTILILIFLGCMSLSFGGLSIGCKTEPDGTICQEGKTSVHKGEELDVYYPVPYASPPNLVLCGSSDDCEIIEQKADHFRIRCKGPFDRAPQWQARGLRCPPPGATPTVVVTPPAPPAAPPPPTNGGSVPLPAPTPVQTP